MRLELIDGKMPTSPTLAEHVTRKFDRVLRPFARRLGAVEVRIVDQAHRRRGANRTCSVLAHINRSGLVSVQARHQDYYAAVAIAATRLRRAVEHVLGRRTLTTPNHRSARSPE
ncbi:MAG: hypothetical protein GIKADHBN_00181 [Phycisphaerales bacterium]|nr:hypothetical protein [Phycisphaerales bacterium]